MKSLKPLLVSRKKVLSYLAKLKPESDSEDMSEPQRKRFKQSSDRDAVEIDGTIQVNVLEVKIGGNVCLGVCSFRCFNRGEVKSDEESSGGKDDESVGHLLVSESSQSWQAPELNIFDAPDLIFTRC
jgi:hypothetical protein